MPVTSVLRNAGGVLIRKFEILMPPMPFDFQKRLN